MTDETPSGNWTSSRIFTIVPSSGKGHPVHSELLRQKCNYFKGLLGDNWEGCLEQQSMEVQWEDRDESTVERFISWLYRGEYGFQYPQLLESATSGGVDTEMGESTLPPAPPPPAPQKPAPSDDGNHQILPSLPSIRKKLSFESQKYGRGPLSCRPSYENWRISIGEKCKPASPAGFNYEISILAHAKLYGLAEYSQTEELKNLALRRMIDALICMHKLEEGSPAFSVNAVEALASVIRYIYEHTSVSPRTSDNDELSPRYVLSTFVAQNFVRFMGSENTEAVELFAEVPDFAMDVSKAVATQMKDIETTNELLRTNLVDANAQLDEASTKLATIAERAARAVNVSSPPSSTTPHPIARLAFGAGRSQGPTYTSTSSLNPSTAPAVAPPSGFGTFGNPSRPTPIAMTSISASSPFAAAGSTAAPTSAMYMPNSTTGGSVFDSFTATASAAPANMSSNATSRPRP